jgi:transglutaminase-like putative cysteine protease
MNRYHLYHVTEFVYDGPVSESYNEVRLRPMHDETQSCLSFRLTTNPASPAFSYRDALGNWVHQVNILPEHTKLRVQAESVVLTHDISTITSAMSLGELDQRHEELVEEF